LNSQLILPLQNEKSFEQLFRQQYSKLCGYARKYIDDPDQSEEVVQDVFVNLWQKRKSIDITSTIESYLFRAVRNTCLNTLKHFKIREKHQEGIAATYDNAGNQPENRILEIELLNQIEDLISALPPERQRIFKMSRLDGMKYREIADELGISVKTVEAQMGKALKYLRKHLSDYLPVVIFAWLLYLLNNLR
jgi:RNA polymerase sigma-70 factor (ECF subfamily)